MKGGGGVSRAEQPGGRGQIGVDTMYICTMDALGWHLQVLDMVLGRAAAAARVLLEIWRGKRQAPCMVRMRWSQLGGGDRQGQM